MVGADSGAGDAVRAVAAEHGVGPHLGLGAGAEIPVPDPRRLLAVRSGSTAITSTLPRKSTCGQLGQPFAEHLLELRLVEHVGRGVAVHLSRTDPG